MFMLPLKNDFYTPIKFKLKEYHVVLDLQSVFNDWRVTVGSISTAFLCVYYIIIIFLLKH